MISTHFTLERTSEPDIEPVTLAEMKRHLRCFDSVTTEDADITNLIVGGREWVENYTGRALIDQTWRLTLRGRTDAFAGGDIVGGFSGGFCYSGMWRWHRTGEIWLKKSPVLAISSFVSVDADGTETAVDAATYELRESDSKWPRIVALNGATWATWLASDLRITYRAGFADRTGSPVQTAAEVPERYKVAIKLWAEAMYDRDPVMMDKLLAAAENIIKPERTNLQFA